MPCWALSVAWPCFAVVVAERLAIQNFKKRASARFFCAPEGRSVEDLLEVKAVGGGADGRFAVREAGRLVEQAGEIVQTESPLGGVDGSAGEQANHFVEETVAVKGQAVAIEQRFEVGRIDRAGPIGVRGFIPTVGGEALEIVSSPEELQRLS